MPDRQQSNRWGRVIERGLLVLVALLSGGGTSFATMKTFAPQAVLEERVRELENQLSATKQRIEDHMSTDSQTGGAQWNAIRENLKTATKLEGRVDTVEEDVRALYGGEPCTMK